MFGADGPGAKGRRVRAQRGAPCRRPGGSQDGTTEAYQPAGGRGRWASYWFRPAGQDPARHQHVCVCLSAMWIPTSVRAYVRACKLMSPRMCGCRCSAVVQMLVMDETNTKSEKHAPSGAASPSPPPAAARGEAAATERGGVWEREVEAMTERAIYEELKTLGVMKVGWHQGTLCLSACQHA